MGKSTLLNHILGMKLSITSRKPQTTRHQILGVKTSDNVQTVYVDTPGIHQRRSSAINRYMNRAATSVLSDVDVVLFVVRAGKWTEEDQAALEQLEHVSIPVILVINKIDQLDDKDALLPYVQQMSSRFKFTDVVPVSALKGDNIERLESGSNRFAP